MSLTSSTSRASFGVTSATNFPFAFKIFDAADIVVTRTDSTGVSTTVSPSLYTVNGVGVDTGSIDYPTHSATDLGLVILRVLDYTQPTVLRNQSNFYADVVEKAFDRVVMLVQQVYEILNRSIKVPVGSTVDPTLPAPVEGTVLGWASGQLRNLSAATAQLAADLLSSAANKGASLVVYLAPLTGAVVRTVAQVIGDFPVSVKWFGAMGNGVTDDYTAVQAALDAVRAMGGGMVWFPTGVYICNTPLYVWDGVILCCEGWLASRIIKDSTTTKSVTPTATGGLVVYGNVALPSNINAVIILDGPTGRYRGGIRGLSIESTLATPGNYETQKAEFGVVSIGSVSDFSFEQCRILQTQYSLLLPTVFASSIVNNRYENCLRGPAYDDGTSLLHTSNYANNCRDWGHFIRGMKYSKIINNACDHLNDPVKYPTRTRVCSAYRLRSLVGCSAESNGDEQTYGNSYFLETLDNTVIKNNTTIGLGSDYSGASEIAWIYSDGVLRNCTVEDNIAYTYKGTGLISGSANAGKHHNIYFVATTYVVNSTFENNKVRLDLSTTTEGGWGNNVPTTWTNAANGGRRIYSFSPTVQAQVAGDLSVAYGADNKHYAEQKGSLLHVWGCFHVTLTYTTASGLLVINSFPTVGNSPAALSVVGVMGGSALVAKLGWFEFSAGGTGGVGRTDGDSNFVITDIPTGTTVRIFYDGNYVIT